MSDRNVSPPFSMSFVKVFCMGFFVLGGFAQAQDRFPSQEEAPNEAPYPQKATEQKAPDYSYKGPPEPFKQYKKVPHPRANEGLTRIDRDGVYYYKRVESEQTNSMTVNFGSLSPPNLVNDVVDYSDVYGESNLTTLVVDYEWPYRMSFGEVGLKAIFGLAFAQGNGVFADPSVGVDGALELYTLYTIPILFGGIYKFKLSDDAFFIPYLEAAAGGYLFIETRDDNGDNSWDIAAGGLGGGGLMINLSSLDLENAIILDNDYGINDLYLNIGAKFLAGAGTAASVSSLMINVGFTADF